MHKGIGTLALIFFIGIFLNSCVTHVTKDMADELKQNDLYAAYGTKIQDFAHLSKCSNLSVKIVDAEKINSESKFCSPDLITNC